MAAGERRLQAVRRFSNRRYWILNGTVDSLLSPTRATRRYNGKRALSVCDVRLFVCPLSVANRTYMRLVRKLTNQSTRKCRTTLRPWNSFTGCSTMTSSQIKDGGRKKIVTLSCLGEKLSDYDEIWYTESDSDCDKIWIKIPHFFNSRWHTNAISENNLFSHNSAAKCTIFAKFLRKDANLRVMMIECENQHFKSKIA